MATGADLALGKGRGSPGLFTGVPPGFYPPPSAPGPGIVIMMIDCAGMENRKMINKQIAENLKHGTELYSSLRKDSRGNPAKVRVSGKCQTWKTRPNDFSLPVKFGLYESFRIVNDAFAEHWHLTEEEARAAFPSGTVESHRYVDAHGRIVQVSTVKKID